MNDRQRTALQIMRASGAFICVWRQKYQLIPAHKTCRLGTDEVEELFDAGLLEVRKLLPWQLELVKHHKLKVVAALFITDRPKRRLSESMSKGRTS